MESRTASCSPVSCFMLCCYKASCNSIIPGLQTNTNKLFCAISNNKLPAAGITTLAETWHHLWWITAQYKDSPGGGENDHADRCKNLCKGGWQSGNTWKLFLFLEDIASELNYSKIIFNLHLLSTCQHCFERRDPRFHHHIIFGIIRQFFLERLIASIFLNVGMCHFLRQELA